MECPEGIREGAVGQAEILENDHYRGAAGRNQRPISPMMFPEKTFVSIVTFEFGAYTNIACDTGDEVELVPMLTDVLGDAAPAESDVDPAS